MRFRTPDECRRKANQHWELAGLARQDRDFIDMENHTRLARLWEERAVCGGYWEKDGK